MEANRTPNTPGAVESLYIDKNGELIPLMIETKVMLGSRRDPCSSHRYRFLLNIEYYM